MRLCDIAKRIDKSKKNEVEVDVVKICEELGINFYDWIEQNRLKSYWIAKWLGTDRIVGYKMYFLDDIPVALSTQCSRSTDEAFKWFDINSANIVKDYLFELIQPINDLNIVTCNIASEIEDSYKIYFNDGVLDWSKGRYKGKSFNFIERIKETPDYGIDTKIKLEIPEYGEIIVDICEIDFLYQLTE